MFVPSAAMFAVSGGEALSAPLFLAFLKREYADAYH